MKTLTKGNVIVEDIKVGDINYEFEYNIGMKLEVLTLPTRTDDGVWTWKSKNVNTDKEVDYLVNEKYSHYGPNLYDYIAYNVSKWI
jgi:hypothetical protein